VGLPAVSLGIPHSTGSADPIYAHARVYLAFNGPNGDIDPSDLGLLAFDGLHPNGRGHRRIAGLLRALGYSPNGKWNMENETASKSLSDCLFTISR